MKVKSCRRTAERRSGVLFGEVADDLEGGVDFSFAIVDVAGMADAQIAHVPRTQTPPLPHRLLEVGARHAMNAVDRHGGAHLRMHRRIDARAGDLLQSGAQAVGEEAYAAAD